MIGGVRLLALRPGEGRIVALLAGLFATIEAGRGLGEVAADTLVISRFGAESLPYRFIAHGMASMVVALAYGSGARGRPPRRRRSAARLRWPRQIEQPVDDFGRAERLAFDLGEKRGPRIRRIGVLETGAGRVIATASTEEKRALCVRLGSDAAIDPAVDDRYLDRLARPVVGDGDALGHVERH